MNLFANCNGFISSGSNLDKRFFSLLVKFTASLDVLDKASRKETDANWINFLPFTHTKKIGDSVLGGCVCFMVCLK